MNIEGEWKEYFQFSTTVFRMFGSLTRSLDPTPPSPLLKKEGGIMVQGKVFLKGKGLEGRGGGGGGADTFPI